MYDNDYRDFATLPLTLFHRTLTLSMNSPDQRQVWVWAKTTVWLDPAPCSRAGQVVKPPVRERAPPSVLRQPQLVASTSHLGNCSPPWGSLALVDRGTPSSCPTWLRSAPMRWQVR